MPPQYHFARRFSCTAALLLASLAGAQSAVLSTSVSPQNGSGSSQVFTFVFTDSAGYQNISFGYIIFTGDAGSPVCWMVIEQTGVELAPDNYSAAWSRTAYGSNTTLQNSQCTVNGATTTASGSGNILTVNLSLTFRVAFAGMKTRE